MKLAAIFFAFMSILGCGTSSILFVCPELKKIPGSSLTTESVCKNYQLAVQRMETDALVINKKGEPFVIRYGASPDLYESFLRDRTNLLKNVCDKEKADMLLFAFIYPAPDSQIGYSYRLYAFLNRQGITRSLTLSSKPLHPDNFCLESFWIGNFITVLEEIGVDL